MFLWILWIVVGLGATYVLIFVTYVLVSRAIFLKDKGGDDNLGLIISPSFGTTIKPEVVLQGNASLAKIIFSLWQIAKNNHEANQSKYAMPIVAVQEEVAGALRYFYKSRCPFITHEVKSQIDGNYQGAFDVITNILKVCLDNTMKIVFVVHPAMCLRVVMIAYCLGLDFIIKPGKEVYDKRSDQLWTRHDMLFYFFEPIKCLVDFGRCLVYLFSK